MRGAFFVLPCETFFIYLFIFFEFPEIGEFQRPSRRGRFRTSLVGCFFCFSASRSHSLFRASGVYLRLPDSENERERNLRNEFQEIQGPGALSG
jgi:hypothetical protein